MLKLARKVLSYWYLLALSVVIALALAFLVNRYTVPLYTMQSAVMITEPVEEGASAAAILYGAEVFQGAKGLTNETIVLKMPALALQTLQKLDFGVSYFQEGNIKLTEVYGGLSPFVVEVDSASAHIPYGVLFKVKFSDPLHYTLASENQGWQPLLTKRRFKAGEVAEVNGFVFTLRTTSSEPQDVPNELLFQVNDLKALANHYAWALEVSPYGAGASALTLKLTGPTPQKEMDFLNAHMETYRHNNLAIKNTNAVNTLRFIDEQLQQISDSLYFIESRLEEFKERNASLDLSGEGGKIAGEIQGLEQQKAGLLVNEKYYQYLRNYLKRGKEEEEIVAPAHLGISDPILNGLTGQLVELQAAISKLSKSPNKANPLVREELAAKKQQLSELKAVMLENLASIESANNIALRDLNDRINRASVSLRKLPAAERQLINIQRLYGLSEGLYVFLMEKRAEAGIAKAANTSDVTILHEAYVGGQIAPTSSKNYFVALLLGLGIPVGVILLRDLLNNRVSTAEDLKKSTTLPLLGLVGHNSRSNSYLGDLSPRSALAEAFRTVRSNLRFMTSTGTGRGKIFVITSSISGEGKTFCAKNLAYIFAISGERTLLVNADMRKPNNNTSFGINSNIGLSNYLAGHAAMEEIIHPSIQEHLHILPAGEIPPNPSELLLSKRLDYLIGELKQRYDYVILDTPPIGILSDGLELMQLADANIFMVRENYSLKNFLDNIQQQYVAGKIKNIAILFNDVNPKELNKGYGYGYGYGYYADDLEPKPWWRKLTEV